MGTECSEDILIVDFPDRPKDNLSAYVTEDGTMLIVSASESCGATNRLYYYDLKAVNNKIDGRLKIKPIFTDNESRYDVSFYFHKNFNNSAFLVRSQHWTRQSIDCYKPRCSIEQACQS